MEGEARMPPEQEVNEQVLAMKYLLVAVTSLGYLAFTWSTVVLLGGFVTLLQPKDFWCLTVISMMQAARIFDELADHQLPNFIDIVQILLGETITVHEEIRYIFVTCWHEPNLSVAKSEWCRSISRVLFVAVIHIPVLGVSYIVMFIYRFGPISCIALALWRIGQRDYGITDGDVNSKKNLMPALDVFYSLVVCQGVFYLIWFIAEHELVGMLNSAREEFKLPQACWSRASLVDYLFDFQERCWRDPTSTHCRTLRHYAVDLLDSGSWEDNISGARMLDFFIRQEQDVRSLLLPSRPKIQKLIDALGWRNDLLQAGASSREMRVHAAYIVAHLASDIHLAQFPGAIRCISSLFQDEETTSLSSNGHQRGHSHPHCTEPPPKKRDMIRRLRKVEYKDKDGAGDEKEEVEDGAGGCNELILQGLKILENLASDQHNCRDICSTPGFVRKIMEPTICSATLIQDIKIIDWAQVVIASFSVLNQLLVSAPGKTGRRLRREISTNKQAMANLEYIIDQSNGANQVLQMQALEILTHLASDLSINLSIETKENLIKKLLLIFLLADEDGQVPISVADHYYDPLKATAAQALALLSTTSENCAFVMGGCDDIILCYLAEKLSASNNVVYRRNAADILGNLCTHCSLDKEYVKEILLPKVLTEILSTTRESAQSEISTPENYKENQKNYASEQDEENPRSISTQAVNTEIREISSSVDRYKSFDTDNEEETATKELQEAFLSLTLVIYDKIISADDFDDVLQKKALGQGAFVGKLKSIVKENCQATAESLRTVKLCGQIAVSMMRRNQYTAQFRDQKFVKPLSKCSAIMSNLESSMLFSGTDFGHNNTVRPLLYDIKNEALGLVNC